jgi:hypothetical protein
MSDEEFLWTAMELQEVVKEGASEETMMEVFLHLATRKENN